MYFVSFSLSASPLDHGQIIVVKGLTKVTVCFRSGHGPFRAALPEGWYGAGLGQLHRQMDHRISSAEPKNESIKRGPSIKSQKETTDNILSFEEKHFI